MNKLFSRPLRSGLLAAGLLSCMMAPIAAGAMPMPPVKAPSSDVTQVRDAPQTYQSPNIWIRRNQGNWRRGNSHWDGRRYWNHHRHWNHYRHWRDDSWRYRRYYRGGSGFYLGLGVVPSYDYYDVPRYVVPRRHYRSLSSAHIRWCYSRYRSYRAWDNSWQPYHGPRRQCRSPYG
jgi:hypothetical protein